MTRSNFESSITPGTPPLSRETLVGLAPDRIIAGRNVSKADVSRYRIAGQAVAVKDYGSRPFYARHTAGRLLVRRECRAYARAGPMPGLATFLGRLGPYALATGWIDGVPLAEIPRGTATAETFDRLDSVIDRLHARGVAFADLHHRDVLVSADGAVHIVDLAAAYVLSSRPTPLGRRVFSRLCSLDRLAAARMRARFTGGSEDEALAMLDRRDVELWGAGRRLKSFWDKLRGRL